MKKLSYLILFFLLPVFTISAQENTKPLVLVDDNIRNIDPESMNPDLIVSITVLKDNEASVYGESGKNGVILITTTDAGKPSRVSGEGTQQKPLVLVNGNEYRGSVDSLDINLIKEVSVFKDDIGKKKYGEKGRNGVILIALKESGIM